MSDEEPNMDSDQIYISILAGGSGTRLWPLSRRARPKHLIELVNGSSLLQATVERVRPIVPDDHIYIVTIRDHVPLIREQVPFVPEGNLVVEPAPKGTGPCLGLAAMRLARRDPSAVMISLHADHVVRRTDRFLELLRAAVKAAGRGHLVTLGIVPTYAETGYGYIHRGERFDDAGGEPVFAVRRFMEKPSPEIAQGFVRSGEYYWNSGYFVWRVRDILAEMRRLLPQQYGQLTHIGSALGTDEESEVIDAVWPQIEPVTIDVGVMERAQNVVVIPTDIGWSDVGTWASLAAVMERDDAGNSSMGSGETVALDTSGTLIHSGSRVVAAVGIRDMVVVDTDDVLLICPKDRAQDVRLLVQEMRKRGKGESL